MVKCSSRHFLPNIIYTQTLARLSQLLIITITIRAMERREMTRHKVHDGSTARFPSLRNRKLSKEYHVTNARGLQRSFSVNSAENDVLDFNRQKMRFTSFKRTLYNAQMV